MRKILTATAAAAALGIGALAFDAIAPVRAQEDPSDDTPDVPDGEGIGPRHPHPHPGPRILDDALNELVENETLTQEQADAVRAEVRERVEALPPGPGRPGHPGHPVFRILHSAFEVAAEVIGVEVSALRDAVRYGQSVADVAAANGVERQAVADAIVARAAEALAEAETEGRIEPERAAEIRERIPEHAERFVDHTRPAEDD